MSRMLRCFCVLLLVLAPAATPPLIAGEPVFRSFEGTQRILVDEPMQPATFPPISLAFATAAWAADGNLVNGIDCRAVVKRDGRGVKGIRVSYDPQIIDLDEGTILSDPPGKTRPTNKNATFPLPDLSAFFPDEEMPALGVVVQGGVVGNALIDELRVTCAGKNRERCVEDLDTICAGGNKRFDLGASWDNGAQSGDGGIFRRTGAGGEFYFFSQNIPELTVKILNGCNINGHYWVFYAATTNVGWDLTVTDTQSGETQSYTNPIGQPAQAITDTSAFATCP